VDSFGFRLIGRDDQLAACREALSGEVGGVVFAGEPGVGLTALARAVAQSLRAHGGEVTWLSGMAADSSVPLCALAPVLPPGWQPHDHPLGVFNAVAERFAAQGGRAGAALVIDDAHMLDASSAALVAQLAVRRVAFIVLTVHRGRPVQQAISTLWKDSVVRRVDVPPLPAEVLDSLMDRRLGGTVDGVTRHRLLEAAAGRPAVLRELLASGLHNGALEERFGVWRWKGYLGGSLRVTELIASRLEACRSPVRYALEVVAVDGGQLPLSIVEQLVEPGALAEAERSGLLRTETAGKRTCCRLTNPLHCHAIRDLTPATTARTILTRLVSAMAATPMRRWDDAVRVARWQFDARCVTEPRVLLPAARLVRHSDPVLAEWCARAAAEAGHGAEADLLLAQMLEFSGRSAEAASVLDGVSPAQAEKGAHAVTAATVYYWGLGSRARAEAALDRAKTEPDRALAEALRSWILLFDGSAEEALTVARTVLSGRFTCEQATVWAAAAGAGAAGLLGLLDEALDLRERGLAAIEPRPERLPWARAQVEYGACAATYFCGDVAAAGRIADEGYRAAAVAQSPLLLGGWALLRGLLATEAGQVVSAQTMLREAAALLEETDTRLHAFCLAQLAGAAALAGHTVSLEEPHSDINRVLHPWHERARAWVLASKGLISEAVTVLTRSAAGTASPAVKVHLLYDAARLGSAASVEARLGELARQLDSGFAHALAVCAAALSNPDRSRPDLVARAAATLAELGHVPLASEALSVAARAARRLGQRPRAMLYVEEAAALARRCEGVRTPLLTFAATPALTPREQEVLMMAATHTSPQIASRLGVAVSTVNNHLASAYAKFGIAGRRELVALLGIDNDA
jgi:DNA-binding CsgD family transcriptional regulator